MKAKDTPREYARRVAAQGIGLLAHAVGYCDGRRYRYTDRERFEGLMREVVAFIEGGNIEPVEPTKHDARFATFLATTIAGAGGDHG